jgi:MFS family permease
VTSKTSSTTNLQPVHYSTSKTLFSKDKIRTSLRASTVDGFCTTVFSLTTGGILLSNFLVELGASPVVFGILSSIPTLVNLIQPIGAYFSERITSRFRYSIWTYGNSRILWLILVIGIIGASLGRVNYQQLQILTLFILLFSHLLNALGYSSWLSWLAIIVPRRLRGRYFGLRNSVVSLTNLTCIPLAGLSVSMWPGGTLQGYGVVLFVGVLLGATSLVCQYFQLDINPLSQNAHFTKLFEKQPTQMKVEGDQEQADNESKSSSSLSALPTLPATEHPPASPSPVAPLPVSSDLLEHSVTPNQPSRTEKSFWRNSNFLMFLTYFGIWQAAMHLSVPFFTFYMLNKLNLDVSLVTLYGSIQAGANLLLLMMWGKLADRIGNLQILVIVGILVIITPILWLGIGRDVVDIWLWLPLLHVFIGGTWAALDLCNNNLQIEIAPMQHQSMYFSFIAAIGGISGALGTIIGGFIAENPSYGGISGLFIVSSLFRFVAVIPLIFINEPGRTSLTQAIQTLWQYLPKEARNKSLIN